MTWSANDLCAPELLAGVVLDFFPQASDPHAQDAQRRTNELFARNERFLDRTIQLNSQLKSAVRGMNLDVIHPRTLSAVIS